MPQLDPSTFGSQLFWLLVCFGALYLVLSFIVIPRISNTLTARAETLEGDLAEAEKLRGQAETALKAYEDALAEARSRALALAQEMRAEVQAETDRQKLSLIPSWPNKRLRRMLPMTCGNGRFERCRRRIGRRCYRGHRIG